LSSARKRSLISSRKMDYREGNEDNESPIQSGKENGVRKSMQRVSMGSGFKFEFKGSKTSVS
jgi:hypothetical protein